MNRVYHTIAFLSTKFFSLLGILFRKRGIMELTGYLRPERKGGIKMTSKELLYIGDALGHEKYFLTKCRELSEQLSDPSLRELAGSMTESHRQIFSEIYGLLS